MYLLNKKLILIFGIFYITLSSFSYADSSKLKYMKDYLELIELSMPNNGAFEVFSNQERIAPLKINTTAGSNYLLKLVSIGSNKTVMAIFVRGGDSVTTKVPLGNYTIKYASGNNNWYGSKHLFGKETQYSKADSTFDFKQTYNQISGYTVSLFRVSNGNLRTSTINPSEF